LSLLIPNVGETKLLADLLSGGSLENWSLRLFTDAGTPAETDTHLTRTEATFTGYTAKTLVRAVGVGNWSTPASGSPTGSWSAETLVAESVYESQVWSPASSQTVEGYFILGSTSGILILEEKFSSSKPLTNGDTLTLIPRLGLS